MISSRAFAMTVATTRTAATQRVLRGTMGCAARRGQFSLDHMFQFRGNSADSILSWSPPSKARPCRSGRRRRPENRAVMTWSMSGFVPELDLRHGTIPLPTSGRAGLERAPAARQAPPVGPGTGRSGEPPDAGSRQTGVARQPACEIGGHVGQRDVGGRESVVAGNPSRGILKRL